MELALQLIEKAKLTKATRLDLGRYGLTNLPDRLFELVWLEELILSENEELFDLYKLQKLINLKVLDISNTQVVDLSPLKSLFKLEILILYRTKVVDLNPLSELINLKKLDISISDVNNIEPLKALSSLEWLDLYRTHVRDLEPIRSLVNLQKLDFQYTKVIDLSPLEKMVAMQKLDFQYTKVKDLTPLRNMLNLQELNVFRSMVSDLIPLQGLTNLQRLNVSQTKVSDLRPLKELMVKLKVETSKWQNYNEIFVKDCPLVNPPMEIVKQGNNAILRYLEEKERSGSIVLNEARLLIVGQAGAGKTSLRTKLMDSSATLPTPDLTTRGIDIELWHFDTEKGQFVLQIWDFGGQNIQHYAHQFFLSDSVVYALVRDERKEDGGMSYWLNIISLLGKDSPVIIVQNLKEGHGEEIKELAAIRKAFPKVQEPIKLDLQKAGLEDYRPFDELRKEICHLASKLPHVGRSYAASYKYLQDDLVEVSKYKKFCTYSEYEGMCEAQGIMNKETMKDFLRSYHQLGIALWFEDDIDLENYVFLSPKWIIDALFELLYEGGQRRKESIVDVQSVKSIWMGKEYEGMRGTLLRLMKNFEMCYEMNDSHYLIPQNQPPCDIEIKESLLTTKVLFEYEFLPKGFLTRLTCRLHHRINKQNVWSNAVIFGEGSLTTVLVYETYEKNVIELIAEGSGKAQLLNETVRQLDAIHKESKFKNLHVKKLMPCPCQTCQSMDKPYFFDYDYLQRKWMKNSKTVECNNSLNEVNIRDVLKEIRIFSVSLIREHIASNKINEALELMKVKYGNEDELIEITRKLKEAHDSYLLGRTTLEVYNATKSKLVQFIIERLS